MAAKNKRRKVFKSSFLRYRSKSSGVGGRKIQHLPQNGIYSSLVTLTATHGATLTQLANTQGELATWLQWVLDNSSGQTHTDAQTALDNLYG